MPRSFCIPGIIILGLALACGLLASISLPYLPALEVSRTTFHSGTPVPGGQTEAISEIRVRRLALHRGAQELTLPLQCIS